MLLTGDLIRAVTLESAAAIKCWWGATDGVVWRWRKVLVIDRLGTEGSRQLHLMKSKEGASVIKTKEFTEDERQKKREIAKRLNLGRSLVLGYHGPRWTQEEIALLGTLPDAELAKMIGKSANAVRVKRVKMGIDKVSSGFRYSAAKHVVGS